MTAQPDLSMPDDMFIEAAAAWLGDQLAADQIDPVVIIGYRCAAVAAHAREDVVALRMTVDALAARIRELAP